MVGLGVTKCACFDAGKDEEPVTGCSTWFCPNFLHVQSNEQGA